MNYYKEEFTDKFEKEAMVVAKKLGWTETDIKELRGILDGLIKKTVKKPNHDKKAAFDAVDKFLQNK